jgi:Uma2 family endonuclease
MISLIDEPVERQVLHNVSWDEYEAILRQFEERRLRITYDRGTLEIMTRSLKHELYCELLAHFLVILSMELRIPLQFGGSITCKRKVLKKGLEPDKCYWIANAALMQGKTEYDVATDPAPDLALEVEFTRSALNRMNIYAALGVAELWRFNGKTLRVYHLDKNGKYKEQDHSSTFPKLPIAELERFLLQSETQDHATVLRAFREWVRTNLDSDEEKISKSAKSSKKNGKKSKS